MNDYLQVQSCSGVCILVESPVSLLKPVHLGITVLEQVWVMSDPGDE